MRVKFALYIVFLGWGSLSILAPFAEGCAFKKLSPEEIDIGEFKRRSVFFLDGERENAVRAVGKKNVADFEKWVRAENGSQAALAAMITRDALINGAEDLSILSRTALEAPSLSLTPNHHWVVYNTIRQLSGGREGSKLESLRRIAKTNPREFFEEFQRKLAQLGRQSLVNRTELFESEDRASKRDHESLNGVFEALKVAPIAMKNDSGVRTNVDPTVLSDVNLRRVARHFYRDGIELLANGDRVAKALWVTEKVRERFTTSRNLRKEHLGPLATNMLGWDSTKRAFRIADAVPSLHASDLIQLENRLKRTVEGLKRRLDLHHVDFEIEIYVAELKDVWAGIHGEIMNAQGSRMLIDGRPVYLRVLED